MTATLTLTRPMRWIEFAVRLLRRRPSHAAMTKAEVEAARRRRDFILDRLSDNPDAFASACGVQAMMALYPHDF